MNTSQSTQKGKRDIVSLGKFQFNVHLDPLNVRFQNRGQEWRGGIWNLGVSHGSGHKQAQEKSLGQPGEEIGSRRQNVPFLSHPQRARTQTLGSVCDRSLGHDFIENHRQQSLIGDDHLTEYLLKMLLLRISISWLPSLWPWLRLALHLMKFEKLEKFVKLLNSRWSRFDIGCHTCPGGLICQKQFY